MWTVVLVFRFFLFKNFNSVVNYPNADLADDRFQSFWTRLLENITQTGCKIKCSKVGRSSNVAAVMLRIAPAFDHLLTNPGKSSVKPSSYHG